jgi:hypothetical protein
VSASEFVYFLKPIGMDGPIKIGTSYEPLARLRQLMSWSPFELELIVKVPGSSELERNIHSCFKDAHKHGEWFHPVPRLTDAIAKLVAGVAVDEAIDLNDRRGSILGAALTESGRQRKHYWSRINAGTRAVYGREHKFATPRVEAIMSKWRGSPNLKGTGETPTAEEFAELEAFITALPSSALTWEQRYPGEPVPRWLSFAREAWARVEAVRSEAA